MGTPPFEPAIRNDRIYARGSADDKGNLFMPIRALEALVATAGAPPINLKFNFKGEEEIGSPNLPPFVREHADLLACDFVLCADGGMWGPDTPSLTLGNKGHNGVPGQRPHGIDRPAFRHVWGFGAERRARCIKIGCVIARR